MQADDGLERRSLVVTVFVIVVMLLLLAGTLLVFIAGLRSMRSGLSKNALVTR